MSVMEGFLRGVQAGQAQQQHQQALEDNKLRALVLKHEIDRLKIDDQIRTRELARQNLEFLHGQPAADIPSDDVTSPQPNLPSKSLAGMVSGLQAGASSAMTGGPAAENPGTIAAPDAQATAPATHDVTRRVARAIDIPGVPALNVPGVSVRPRSMEDVIQAQIASKMAEPYTLNPGGVRMIGGTKIGEGGPAFHSVGAGGLAATTPDGETKVVVPGRAPAPVRPLVVNGKVLDPTNPSRVLAVVPPQETPNQKQTEADRQWRQQHTLYQDYTRQEMARYNAEVRAWNRTQAGTRRDAAGNVIITGGSGDPNAPAPTLKLQTFEEWSGQQKPGAGATGAPAPAAAKEGDVQPIPGYPGTEQTFRNGKWIRTK